MKTGIGMSKENIDFSSKRYTKFSCFTVTLLI